MANTAGDSKSTRFIRDVKRFRNLFRLIFRELFSVPEQACNRAIADLLLQANAGIARGSRHGNRQFSEQLFLRRERLVELLVHP